MKKDKRGKFEFYTTLTMTITKVCLLDNRMNSPRHYNSQDSKLSIDFSPFSNTLNGPYSSGCIFIYIKKILIARSPRLIMKTIKPRFVPATNKA